MLVTRSKQTLYPFSTATRQKAIARWVLPMQAGRKHNSKNIKPEPAAAAVLTKIKLHLLAKRQLRHLRVDPVTLLKPQSVRPAKIVNVVAERLLVAR